MRRIIERIVTVVTTTTWTISWKDDPLPTDGTPFDQTQGKVDPAAPADATPDAAPSLPSAIEAKEVHPPKESKK